MTCRYHAGAIEEAGKAGAFYETRKIGLGLEFDVMLRRCVDEILMKPRLFPRVDVPNGSREIRQCLLDKFPYSVAYEIFPDEIVILAVAHHKRRTNYWIRRRA